MRFKWPTDKRSRGQAAETQAWHYLQAQGLRPVCRNYRCRFGEIDLIMQQQSLLVFVEVRFRQQTDFGSPLETVTASKQAKIKATAQYYLLEHALGETQPLRFDVIGITGNTFDWLQHAF